MKGWVVDMAKLAPINTSAGRWGSGRYFEMKLECKVLKDGIFRAAVPQEFRADFFSWISAASDIKARFNGDEISSEKLVDLQIAVNNFAQWKIEAAEEQCLRIWFTVRGLGSYYLTPNKDITPTPHGSLIKGPDSSFSGGSYTTGVSAQIRLVTTMTDRKGNVTFKHDFPQGEIEMGPWGQELLGWSCRVAPSNPNLSQEELDSTIPYTERAAQFFCEQIKVDMQRRNDLTELLGGEPETVSAALDSSVWPMPFV